MNIQTPTNSLLFVYAFVSSLSHGEMQFFNIYVYSNVLSSVFGPVSAVEHASEERKAHRVDV